MKDFIAEKSLCSYLVFPNLKSCLVHDRDLSYFEEPPKLKKNTNKMLFVFAERYSDQFIFQIYPVELQVTLHSLIIYPLHDNLKFKLKNLAVAQF